MELGEQAVRGCSHKPKKYQCARCGAKLCEKCSRETLFYGFVVCKYGCSETANKKLPDSEKLRSRLLKIAKADKKLVRDLNLFFDKFLED